MLEIDTRGLSCPEPLMMVQTAMESHGEKVLKVLISELYTKSNIEKYVLKKGKKPITKQVGTDFEMIIEM